MAFLLLAFAFPLGLLLAGGGAALFWLRGYVVPFTPRFAPALVAADGEVFEAAHAASVSVADGEPDEWVVLSDGSDHFEGETWLSRPVAIAATAAVTRSPTASLRRPSTGPRPARPGCSCPPVRTAGAALEESTTASCCGGYTSPTAEPAEILACSDCGVRLYTFDDGLRATCSR